MDSATEAILSGLPASMTPVTTAVPAAAPAPAEPAAPAPAAPAPAPATPAPDAPKATPSAPAPAPAPAPEPAQPSSTPTAPESGKPSEAPAPGQAAAAPGNSATLAEPVAAKPGQASPAASDESILALTSLQESPDSKLSRLERDYTASSKEARRLLEDSKSLESILKDQGTDIVRDANGISTGLIANKKYSKELPELSLKVKDLPDNVQAQFETDQQKVVDFIVEKMTKAMTRAVPTTNSRTVLPLSLERHETAFAWLTDVKWAEGDLKFPGLAANRKLIEQKLNAPGNSKAFKTYYNQEPEEAMSLLNLQFDHARAHSGVLAQKAVEAAEAKRKIAEGSPQPAPSGGGAPLVGTTPEGDVANQVATARTKY